MSQTQPDIHGSGERLPVPEAELQATVHRMESRLRADAHPEVRTLFRLYEALCPRFEEDLSPHGRDIALARSAALMLIQARRSAG